MRSETKSDTLIHKVSAQWWIPQQTINNINLEASFHLIFARYLISYFYLLLVIVVVFIPFKKFYCNFNLWKIHLGFSQRVYWFLNIVSLLFLSFLILNRLKYHSSKINNILPTLFFLFFKWQEISSVSFIDAKIIALHIFKSAKNLILKV